jgi:dihydroorotate dehydrogenase (fumarate)
VSALYKKGFDVIPEILNGTSTWMKKHKFDSIDSFRGKLSKSKVENPAVLERVQFMKLYSEIE